MEEEKRQAILIKKTLVAMYTPDVDKDKKTWDATIIRDISERGMQVTTNKQFSPDEILTFFIKIPFRPFQWIEVNGRVVASDDLKTVFDESVAGAHITRVEFVDLKENQKELIKAYIEWFMDKKRGKS